jgi:phytanoyl-CoA hydroxylase
MSMEIMSTSTANPADFRRNGYALAPAVFTAQEIQEIANTFMEQAKDGPVEGLSEINHGGATPYNQADPLRRYPRMIHPHSHPDKIVGPVATKYMLDQRLYVLLKAFFGAEPIAVQSMFYFKPPGARGQALHQDNFYLRVKPDTCVAAWIAIDDADAENGAMVVVPGTHDMEIVCPGDADTGTFFTTRAVPVPAGLSETLVELKAGDVLFFNGSLIHGSYPNTSKTRFRRALIMHYVPEGTEELATFYRSPKRFNGEVVAIPEAEGGGPCGDVGAPTSAH